MPHGNKGIRKTPEWKHKIRVSLKGHIQSPETIAKRVAHYSKTWLVTFPDGHTETIVNLHKWGLEHGVNSQNLGRDGKSKGFTCQRVNT